MDNYTIVLFKNKKKKRIIKKFKTKENALNFYNKEIEQNKKIFFGVETENGKSCSYELGLITKTKNHNPLFIRDSMGRSIEMKMEDSDYTILKMNPYKKEEMIYDVKKSKRINFLTFLRIYLPKVGTKLVSKINNKIVIQNDENLHIFSLKCDSDSDRFIDVLNDYMISEKRFDTIIVKDFSKEQKKYLYNLLETNGFSKSIFYRKFTTYKRE
jgi:hypothetical protein